MRTRTRLATLTAVAVLAPLGLAAAADAAPAAARPDPPGRSVTGPEKKPAPGAARRPVPGVYIVTVAPGAEPAAVARGVLASPRFTYSAALNGFSAELTDRQAEALRRHPQVAAVEQDSVVEGDGTQYLDTTGQPWGLDRIDQRTGLSRSYSWRGTGAGVTAYVVDSGIMTSHPEFGGRATAVYDAFGGNGQDCHGHGTHVAGTIGGARYGVAKSVSLRSVRVLDCANRGTVSGILGGVDWVMRNARRPAVANLSLGAPYSPALNNAVTALTRSGVFAAVAAGNSNADACSSSPSSAPGTMTVGSVDWYDRKAVDSNWGGCVDLYAPGVSVQSARNGGGSTVMSGTSMAAPHVAGVAALVKGDYGDVASPDLVSYLVSYTTRNAVSGNVTGTPNRLLFQAGW